MAGEPKPPTCSSCPFWLHERCRINPPMLSRTELTASNAGAQRGIFPMTRADDTCGFHPDFPAYLKARGVQVEAGA